ncbi:MAG: MlaE family lipid ABC transporter permease subunit [Alphaproteobacteria bacterium]|nr:MlaE family lipid ABC transporter permease subunit [Alphaproteobacteria bacterium]
MASAGTFAQSNESGADSPKASARLEGKGGRATLRVEGDWIVVNAMELDRELDALKPEGGQVTFDLSGLGRFDTTGAWLLDRTRGQFEAAGASVELTGGEEAAMSLLAAVQKAEPKPQKRPRRKASAFVGMLARAGAAVESLIAGTREAVGFTGLVILVFARTAVQPIRLRFTSLVHHMEEVGLDAVPIVMLMSFLIGAVLAYQGSEQLERFGASIFTVDLIGISFLREIGILLTAILVAGRSGSAFTAQIGSMKMREEIDAMRTLGLDPMEMLIIPRILALVLMLPLLGFLSNLAGLIGGGFVAVGALDISPIMYLERLQQVLEVSPWHFWVGVIKAPIFAFLIGTIGCFEGLRVSGSAESLGQRTTQSVVESIFTVIIADAFFSILFVSLDI